jgi:hypothetical protein
MNTRIETDFNFLTAVHFEDTFYTNAYDITLSMLVETNSIYEQNIAISRVEYFLKNTLENSILINAKFEEATDKYRTAGIKICHLPEDPLDQILGMVLLLKLNAVMENKLRITDMVISSAMSDGIRCSIVAESAESVLSGNYWWNSPCLSLNNFDETGIDRAKVIKLFNNDEWINLGLSFKEIVKK